MATIELGIEGNIGMIEHHLSEITKDISAMEVYLHTLADISSHTDAIGKHLAKLVTPMPRFIKLTGMLDNAPLRINVMNIARYGLSSMPGGVEVVVGNTVLLVTESVELIDSLIGQE